MNDESGALAELTAVQHPIIPRAALRETVCQLLVMGGVVAILEVFEVRSEVKTTPK